MKNEYNINELISTIDFNSNKYTTVGNGLMLTNNEIDTLKRFNIDYLKCSSLKELVFQIEEACNELDGEDLEQLDYISSTIAERDYYQNTNK